MVSAISTVGSTSAGYASASAGASAGTTTSSASQSSLPPLSPVNLVDPLSGTMITQYLNDAGDLTVQVPSAAAVAYMRMGLTPDGRNDASEQGTVA
jgi:hypothetical protein